MFIVVPVVLTCVCAYVFLCFVAAEIEVMMEPATGVLAPAEKLSIDVTIMSRAPGPFNLLVGCEVEGSDVPLACEITGEVFCFIQIHFLVFLFCCSCCVVLLPCFHSFVCLVRSRLLCVYVLDAWIACHVYDIAAATATAAITTTAAAGGQANADSSVTVQSDSKSRSNTTMMVLLFFCCGSVCCFYTD